MRNLLAAAALLALCSTGAMAQTSQGTTAITASLRVLGSKNEYPNYESTGTIFHISPRVGYFIQDRLEVGVSPNFSFGRNKQQNENGTHITKNHTLSIGPYIKKYIPLSEKLYFTASGSIGVGFGIEKSRAANMETFENGPKIFSYSIGASPGLTYFATEKLGLTLSIGWINFTRMHERSKLFDSQPTHKSTTTSFDATVSPSSTSIGFGYFINR